MPNSAKKKHQRKFIVQNKLGLHARPAALFVQTASRFACDIQVKKGRQQASGKSIMGIMTLAVQMGAVITVTAEGTDARQALDEIGRLVESNFGE